MQTQKVLSQLFSPRKHFQVSQEAGSVEAEQKTFVEGTAWLVIVFLLFSEELVLRGASGVGIGTA